MKARSIRTQLYLVTISALILTSLAILTAQAIEIQTTYRQALESRSITIARNVRETVHKNLLFFPLDQFPGMEDYLRETLAANEGISYLYLADRTGKMLYHSQAGLAGGQVQASLGEQAAGLAPDGALTIAADGHYESIIPILQDGQIIGAIHIGVEKSIIDASILQMLLNGVLILALALLASGALLYWLLNRYFAAPLRNLTETAFQLASGDLERRVQIERQDEIGVLGQAFNQMTAQLRSLYNSLRDSEAHFRSLIENASDIINVLSEDGVILYASPSAQNVLGYAPEEITGCSIYEYAHPDDALQLQAMLHEAGIGAGATAAVEFRIRHKDSRWLSIEATGRSQPVGEAQSGVVMNSRDITERKRRQREREAIITVAAVMRAAADRASMVSPLLEQLVAVLDAEGALLAMHDPLSGDLLVEKGCAAWSLATGVRIPAGEGVSGQVFGAGKPYISAQVQTDAGLADAERFSEVLSAACIPLIAQEKPLGVLWIGSHSPFSAGDISLLAAVSDIAANAIHRAALFEQTEQRLKRLDALRRIDQAITASFDVRLSLDAILDQVKSLLYADASDILLIEPYSQVLSFAAGFGFRTQAAQEVNLRNGEGFAGRVAFERKLLHTPHIAEAEQTPRAALLENEGFKAYYGVPLIAKGHVKGVLEVFQRSAFTAGSDWLDFLETLAGQAAIAIDNAGLFNELQRSNIELTLAYDTTLEGWSRALDLRDRETEGHTQRVADMSVRLARVMGIADADLVHIRRGALLHDIGKMGIPDQILLKGGPLTEAEWEIMRRHPDYAYAMLSPIPFLRQALEIPYCHHEWWNGTGYPRRLSGEQIPQAARLFAVVDVWDALRSDRPYRPAWSERDVRRYILDRSGQQFEPKIVAEFFQKIIQD